MKLNRRNFHFGSVAATALKNLNDYFKLDTAKVQIYKSTDKSQVRNFVEHYFDRKPTQSPAEIGGRSSILCQLCNMSNKMGLPLKRDSYRNGWNVVV